MNTPLWIQLGSGGLHLPEPWQNYDCDVDITRPLPWPDNSARFITSCHLIEHVTPSQAWDFLEQCRRVLVPNGVVRVAFPDITRLWNQFTPAYGSAVKASGGRGDLRADAIHAIINQHGHRAIWTERTLAIVLYALGFKPMIETYGHSSHPDLCNVELHHRTVGEAIARAETCVVEGWKI